MVVFLWRGIDFGLTVQLSDVAASASWQFVLTGAILIESLSLYDSS